jgi:D-amino-acid oxidase
MGWPRREVEDAGVRITQRRIEGRLSDQERALRDELDTGAIVHCTGPGARRRRAGPDVSAARRAHPSDQPRQQDAEGRRGALRPGPAGLDRAGDGLHRSARREDAVARWSDLTEEDEWSLDIGLHNHQPARDMHRRCLHFMPVLEHARLERDEPVRVGLRRVGKGNVCRRPEAGTRIVHNDGHGGSGFSRGCAHEVATIVTRERSTRRMLAHRDTRRPGKRATATSASSHGRASR